MKELKKGNYFGKHKNVLYYDGLVITDTVYTHSFVDWHYHENAYFTYLLQGELFEANKKESYTLTPRTLVFHNWQDAHYNIKKGPSRGFHIEADPSWFEKHHINHSGFEGSIKLDHPLFPALFDRIYRETKINDQETETAIEELILRTIGSISHINQRRGSRNPGWVSVIKEILHSGLLEKITLKDLAKKINIHPVHLSCEFPKYFLLTIGDYIRHLKIERSISLFHDESLSLTEIAYRCGFADQSHFTRYFKKIYGITPSQYRFKFTLR